MRVSTTRERVGTCIIGGEMRVSTMGERGLVHVL